MQCCKSLFKYKRKLKSLFGHQNLWIRFCSTNYDTQLKLNVLFFGTDQFSLKSLLLLDNLRKCNNSKIHRLDVVTSFKAKGNPIKKYTEQNRHLECCDWHSFLTDSNTKVKYDLGVVVSFGHLIPAHIINLFPLGIINIHASLLPRWRGASPIIHAILNDDRRTGVSIMKIHPDKFDVGEILAQREVPIPNAVLMPELHDTLADVGAQLLVECIENAPESFQNAKQQDDTNVTYAPKVTDAMAHIDWHTQTSRYICNLYRAFFSFKWLTTDWHRRRVKIKEIDLASVDRVECESSVIMPPGRIEYDKLNKCLRVYCCDGSFIRVKKLGLEGKKSEMSASDFNNGFLKKVDRAERYFT